MKGETMKKAKKIIAIGFIILLITIHILSITSCATGLTELKPDEYLPSPITDTDEFIDYIGIILSVLRIVGSFVCVLALIILGIRYMIGSTADKATYKETMVPYLIGAIMVFAIPTIIQILYELIKGNIFI